MDLRSMYLLANDPEALPSVLTLTPEFGSGGTESADTAATWAASEAERFAALAARAAGPGAREALVRRAALGVAPLGLVAGAWLQWLSDPGNGDAETTMRVLSLYAEDLGAGHPRSDRGSAYLATLDHLRIADRAVPVTRLAEDPRIRDAAFVVAAPLLAMSRRPREFRPELLGADLCLRTVGLFPPLVVVRDLAADAADWAALDLGSQRRPGAPSGLELSRAAVAALLAESGVQDRVDAGFRWALGALRQWSDALHAELTATLDPAFEMAELLRIRAREGAHYHQDFLLNDRPLSRWMTEARTDPGPLLTALAGSRLLRPGEPDRSPLLRGLVAENGPMFRVFSASDEAVIRRWITALPAAAQPFDLPAAPVAAPFTVAPAAGRDAAPRSLREAYHRLLRRDDSPALRRWAQAYVQGWLARSRADWDQAEHLPPAAWNPRGLRSWLQEQHDRHNAEFRDPAEGALPGREAVIDSTLQLAPLTLIDGSWLQGFTDYGHASSDIGHLLFSTYWDELGNGHLPLNHPLIYREVLEEMSISLPPTESPDFAHHPLFRDESFELPVYWLSIGRMPRTFLPEILGLNVAMELSGVGGSYRRARVALAAHGFSTRFIDIHNTIDNVATGHSAWAADAVDAYMATAPTVLGPRAEPEIWERVRTGYRSLNAPRSRRARRAERRAFRPHEIGKAS